MAYRLFWILIEGNDDARFFEAIIKPIFEGKCGTGAVQIWKYAERQPKMVNNFLRSIDQMGADYIFVTDIDLEPCVTAKKQNKQNKYRNIDTDRIIVVMKEIESWYLAGLDEAMCRKLGMPSFLTTDSVVKETFENYRPNKYDSRIAFMVEILGCFSIEVAKRKNASFRYFTEKHNL